MPQSKTVLMIRSDGMLCSWNSATGKVTEIRTFHLPGTTSAMLMFDIARAPDGTIYAVAGNSLYTLDMDTGEAHLVKQLYRVANAIDIRTNGDIVLGFASNDYIEIFDPITLQPIERFETDPDAGIFGGPNSAGDIQVVGNKAWLTTDEGTVLTFNLHNGKIISVDDAPLAADAFGLAYDGRLIAFVGHSAYALEDGKFTLIQDFDFTQDINGADSLLRVMRYGSDSGNAMTGSLGDDALAGLGGNDTIDGRRGDDFVDGGLGQDRLSGSDGDDRLLGGGGGDTLSGGKGDDRLSGDAGNDLLKGGGGADTFIFAANGGKDRIADFSLAADTLMIDADLTHGKTDLDQIVADYGHVVKGAVVLDFGSTVIRIDGLTTLDGLADVISLF